MSNQALTNGAVSRQNQPGGELFIPTREYLKFQEFVHSCSQYRYIGLCYGYPGVGKTAAAKYVLHWQPFEGYGRIKVFPYQAQPLLSTCNGIFYTVPVTNSPRVIREEVGLLLYQFGFAQLKADGIDDIEQLHYQAPCCCPLVILDEADRLIISSLEQIRDLYDQYGFGLVLIGMPGMEKRLARYPQLFSRVGFCHHFCPLKEEELPDIIEKLWKKLHPHMSSESLAGKEVICEIIRMVGGNLRLTTRLLTQMGRIMKINQLTCANKEVVHGARNCLLIGE